MLTELITLVCLIAFFGPLIAFVGWIIKVIIEEDRRYNAGLEVYGEVLARPWRKLLQDDKKGLEIG